MSLVGIMQRWIDSKSGQTFLNYAYSWGASVVILGTLFKLTHLPGADIMLFLGMGTEVIVFFISGFDRPFEESGDEATAATQQTVASGAPVAGVQGVIAGAATDQSAMAAATDGEGIEGAPAGGVIVAGGNGTTIIGGGPAIIGGTGGGTIVLGGEGGETPAAGEETPAIDPFAPSEGLQAAAAQQGIGSGSLLDIIRLANEEMLQRAQASLTPEMEEASKQYVEKLQLLTDTLDRVEKQSARLTTDSEEMTNLNRTLTGINTVYELQLKSISQQIGTIDSINEQTRRMAAQIEELNGVYARMIKALTVNMKNAANTMGE